METFFILWAWCLILVFICKALSAAGKSLAKPTARKAASPSCNSDHEKRSDTLYDQAMRQRTEQEEQEAEEQRKIREKEKEMQHCKDFIEKYGHVMAEEEKKEFMDYAERDNKAQTDALLLVYAENRIRERAERLRRKS